MALQDPREQLLLAAETVLARDGLKALTSRAVTDEAGVAKGVLHRHFTDFDGFLAALIRNRIDSLDIQREQLDAHVGAHTVTANLGTTLTEIFTDTTLAMVALVTSHKQLRTRLRETSPVGIPILAETTQIVTNYLITEQQVGRVLPRTDIARLALSVVATTHLLFAGELGAFPSASATEEVIETLLLPHLRLPTD